MVAHQINSEERRRLHKLLLMKHGSITELAKELKVRQPTVSGWLAYGRGLSPAKQAKILERVAEIALEFGIVMDSMTETYTLSSTFTDKKLP